VCLPPDLAALHMHVLCAHAAVCAVPCHAHGTHVRCDMRCRRRLELEPDDVLLLLPAGLRPVKDVLFGAREVAAWHAREPRLCLRIVGPELDAAYAAQVRAQLLELGSPRGVAYVGALPQRELHAAMGQARTADLDPPSCASSMTALRGRPPVILHH
jgi:hypothetical protein